MAPGLYRKSRYDARKLASSIDGDVTVQRLGFSSDDSGKRLTFPHAELSTLEGRSGATSYGAKECVFEALEGRLDSLHWKADGASLGAAWLRDDAGKIDLAVDRVELPRGTVLVRANRGVEILSPHVSFSELRLTVKGPFGRPRAGSHAEPTPGLRQEQLRFLDSLSGRIYLTLKVVLDLPVLGLRTLDQQLRVPIQDGSLDFRALEDSLDWLEGRFLDIDFQGERLVVRWKVPIFGSSHDLIEWQLDKDATTLASFGKVPVRSLADFKVVAGDDKPSDKPKSERTLKPDDGRDSLPAGSAAAGRRGVIDKKRKTLQAFAIDAIDIALSLLAPRHLEVGNGLILFGGDDSPGMVDFKVTGAIKDNGPGALKGKIGSVDTTIKDLELGPASLSADRLHFDGIDQLEVTFDGFTPIAVAVVIHRVTATNFKLTIGG